MIHIYTGNGKGKTTAAVGQAVRAAGRGLRVMWIQYCKNTDIMQSGEIIILKKLGIPIYSFAPKIPFFNGTVSRDDVQQECRKSLVFLADLLSNEPYDVAVLDEINICTWQEFMSVKELLPILRKIPADKTVILTGREAHPAVIRCADLVTEMNEIKHPFNKRKKAQKGIEY